MAETSKPLKRLSRSHPKHHLKSLSRENSSWQKPSVCTSTMEFERDTAPYCASPSRKVELYPTSINVHNDSDASTEMADDEIQRRESEPAALEEAANEDEEEIMRKQAEKVMDMEEKRDEDYVEEEEEPSENIVEEEHDEDDETPVVAPGRKSKRRLSIASSDTSTSPKKARSSSLSSVPSESDFGSELSELSEGGDVSSEDGNWVRRKVPRSRSKDKNSSSHNLKSKVPREHSMHKLHRRSGLARKRRIENSDDEQADFRKLKSESVIHVESENVKKRPKSMTLATSRQWKLMTSDDDEDYVDNNERRLKSRKSSSPQIHQSIVVDQSPDKRAHARRKMLNNPNRRDRSGRHELFKYTGNGDLATVQELVKAGADVNLQDYAGWTALHEACLTGKLEIAEYLLKVGANINALGFGDDTPLHDACSNGYPDVVELLVQNGADVHAKNVKGETPLQCCEERDPDSSDKIRCKKIIEKRIQQLQVVLAKNKAGQTSLHRAAIQRNIREVNSLLEKGAEVNARCNSEYTPLHKACLQGFPDIADALIKGGADINAQGFNGNTPLHDASQNGHHDVVRLLLSHGANITLTNDKGETSIDVAQTREIKDILREAVNSKASIIKYERFDIQQPIREHSVETAMSDGGPSDHSQNDRHLNREERKMQQLMRTISKLERDEERKKQGLMKRGRPRRDHEEDDEDDDDEIKFTSPRTRARRKTSNRSSSPGRDSMSVEPERSPSEDIEPKLSPISSRRGHKRSLSSKSADGSDKFKLDPRHKDTSGRTHLHKFASKGDKVMVSKLLENDSVVDARDHAGWTPLHEAALHGHAEVVKLLLDYGANVNARGADADTPLHDGTENGHVEVVRQLLLNGAKPNMRNAEGKAPIELIGKNGNISSSNYKAIEKLLSNAVKNSIDDDSEEEYDDADDTETSLYKKKRRSLEDAPVCEGDRPRRRTREQTTSIKSNGSVSPTKRHVSSNSKDFGEQDTKEPTRTRKRSLLEDLNTSRSNVSSPKRRLVPGTQLPQRRKGSQEDNESSVKEIVRPATPTSQRTHVKDVPKPIKVEKVADERSLEEMLSGSKPRHIIHSPESGPSATRSVEQQRKFAKSPSPVSPMIPLTPPVEITKKPESLKIKTELEDGPISLSSPRPLSAPVGVKKEEGIQTLTTSPTLSEAKKYLPLYTVQLKHEDTGSTSTPESPSRSFFVVDLQVRLLLGLQEKALLLAYPKLFRRLITNREKERLWSPLAPMVSERCAAAVNYLYNPLGFPFTDEDGEEKGCSTGSAITKLKEREKQKFLQMELYFVKLGEIVEVIERDYEYLSGDLITITLDIGYSDAEYTKPHVEEKKDEATPTPDKTALTVTVPERDPGMSSIKSPPLFRLPPKVALKIAKGSPQIGIAPSVLTSSTVSQ